MGTEEVSFCVAGEAAAHNIMKKNFLKLLNASQGSVSPKRILTFYSTGSSEVYIMVLETCSAHHCNLA